jgi:lipoate-protein ligase A
VRVRGRLILHEQGFPERMAFDAAVSRALLARVAEGAAPASLRLYRAGDALAFTGLDRAHSGFPRALEAARAAGFEPVLRLAGGRAAVFHRETLAFAWCVPDPEPRARIRARFDAIAGAVAAALRRLGVDAPIGELAGEYCPGEHSVNARGARKLAGVGQRLVRGAAHVGGVIVVSRSDRVREALEPVYAALGLPFDPETAGSVADEIGPVSCEDVAAALREEFSRRAEVEPAALDAELLERAAALEPWHRAQLANAARSRDDASASSALPAGTRGESWKKTWGMPS